jgi:hypothetical protein
MWPFLQGKKNREFLGWIGAGFAVVIGGSWAAFVHFSAPDKLSPNGSTVQASCGSAAIGGNVITVGNTGDCPEQKSEQKR